MEVIIWRYLGRSQGFQPFLCIRGEGMPDDETERTEINARKNVGKAGR